MNRLEKFNNLLSDNNSEQSDRLKQIKEDFDFDSSFSSMEVVGVKEIKEEASKIGISVNTEKEIEKANKMELISNDYRDLAVRIKLIPENYRDVRFDESKIRENLREQNKRSARMYKIYRFKQYINICSEILTSLRQGVAPKRSYIIGAPNGFGKSSFVNEALIIMKQHDWVCAPYISLSELAILRTAEEQRLMRPFDARLKQMRYNIDTDEFIKQNGYPEYNYRNPKEPIDLVKVPTVITSNYSWSEYINAKCLFVHFTDVISKDLESHMLYQLLSIRGAKGLPTIAMISTSLDPYVNDFTLKELVWDEIKSTKEESDSYDRVTHISCYKKRKDSLALNDKDDDDTGIID